MSTPSGFDLGTAATRAAKEDEGQDLHVRDVDGQPYTNPAFTIRVAGTYSKVYRDMVNVQRDHLLRQRRTQLTGEALSRQQLDLTAACILSWEGLTDNGQPVPHSRENAVRLLTAAPWIREQVEEAMADHAGFFGNSSPS
jgi:hypothetical protein